MKEEIKVLMEKVEAYSLDRELFLREAKCYYLLPDNVGNQ